MKISISGFIFVKDMDSGLKFGTRKNHAKLEIKRIFNLYIVFLHKFVDDSKSTYYLSNLDCVIFKEKEFVLKFVKPNYEVIVVSDDDDQVESFLDELRSLFEFLIDENEQFFLAKIIKSYEHIYNFSKMEKIDTTRLRTVALEYCDVPHLPEGIGHLALSSLSLNYSRIDMSENGQDLFWDWMTKHNISTSLTTLRMRSIGLNKLPFEIMHLKRLQTLELSANKLTQIPHFIGELPEILQILVDNNLLSYFPDNLLDIFFDFTFLWFNRFPKSKFDEKPHENIESTRLRNVPKLLDLSVLSLFKNDVKFKRKEIPRHLWNSFDSVCRCKICKKLLIFDEKYQRFHFSCSRLCKADLKINWQFFLCPKCTYILDKKMLMITKLYF